MFFVLFALFFIPFIGQEHHAVLTTLTSFIFLVRLAEKCQLIESVNHFR